MCLTATATPRVHADIITSLDLDPSKLKLFTMTTARPNLHYELRFTSSADEDEPFTSFMSWLKGYYARRQANLTQQPPNQTAANTPNPRASAAAGIIYIPSRALADQLSARLRAHGVGAAAYHAGLTPSDRVNVQAAWLAGREGHDIVVATTAFGMGIDKTDVRFVVHWSVPKSFEGYYQEAGRAGRDGKAALCLLYYSREERDRMVWRIGKDNASNASRKNAAVEARSRENSFKKLVEYCEGTAKCRHRLICEYFGETQMPVCDFACDVCKAGPVEILKAKEKGLASEEWIGTQREAGALDLGNEGWD